ncbi:uncharacterized protein BO80DRAFT_428487 [Aspergillus ibericus CBS 121593]|uniref:Uncharacterized protein n=1 Tax=Aspergillus ibericus CBS 121593 TaxID=1448316 RepID=A0A395GQZ5_9EURO|nr:hypothetical protein BO80DRAFT_428487 [Aspergillus ibericus CBS 121593]RAK97147.1 hypothetical protein BO80DRAFT_428487 [Aspergillus ibericus CBS 121593]
MCTEHQLCLLLSLLSGSLCVSSAGAPCDGGRFATRYSPGTEILSPVLCLVESLAPKEGARPRPGPEIVTSDLLCPGAEFDSF